MGGANGLGGSVTVVESDEVTIERRIHPSGTDESFVTIAVRNTGDSAVSVRLQEEVSDAVANATPIDSLDQDASSWRFDGDRICHEYEVAAADNRAIIYEVELDEGRPETELSRPSIVDVVPVEGSPGAVAGGALWRGGAAAGDPGHSGDDDAPATTTPASSPESEMSDSEPSNAAPSGSEPSELLDRLVAAVESADAADLEPLREHLRPERSERIKLEHVRSRVDDVEAYGEAMEAFLDQHGRPTDVIDDVDDRITEVERELRASRAEVDRLGDASRERQRLFETTAEQFEDELERLEREFADLRERVEEWHDTQNRIAAALSGQTTDDCPDA